VVVFDGKSGGVGEPAQLFVQATSRDAFHPAADRARQMMVMTTRTDGIPVTASGMNAMQQAEVGQDVDGSKDSRPSHSFGAQTVGELLGCKRPMVPLEWHAPRPGGARFDGNRASANVSSHSWPVTPKSVCT